MAKKATLLIRNLEQIYPLTPNVKSVISQGFIAVHHDRILALGEGAGSAYIDKDTRIVEGRSHIAVPGMIDICLSLHECTSMRELWEIGHRLVQCGTMIVHSQPLPKSWHDVLHPVRIVDGHFDPLENPLPLYDWQHPPLTVARRFCISTHYPQSDCLDQLLCAKICLAQQPQLHPTQVLAACSAYPAMALGYNDLGKLKRGARANIILLEGNDLASVLRRFHGDESMQIVKDGVRLWPHLLI